MKRKLFAVTTLFIFLSLIHLPQARAANAQDRASDDREHGAQPSSRTEPATPQTTEAIFTNSTPINITPGGPVNAGPYPSSINVSGLTGLIPFTPGSVRVTLNNFSHDHANDIGIVLVGPRGTAMLVQDGAGGAGSISNVTYTLSDTGGAPLPNGTWAAGTYTPASYFVGDSFPAPGPGIGYTNPGPVLTGAFPATFASTFGGTNPNGTWSLYIRDFANGAGGSFAGGWTLEVVGGGTQHRAVLDFDGDNRTDDTTVRNVGGSFYWYTLGSTAGFSAVAWGLNGDQLVPEDYDGDGKTDLAIYRSGVFHILRSSSNSLQSINWGLAGDDARITQDFDNDGLADPAVARNGASNIDYHILRSSLGYTTTTFGIPITDLTIRGDFDGDGRADLAVYRRHVGTPANSFIISPSGGGPLRVVNFGTSVSDYIVPADFDGDGRTDIAVYRGIGAGANGNWYWLRSSDGVLSSVNWGLPGDFPVPGDYNGDGRTDPSVWRGGAPGAFHHLGLASTSFGNFGDLQPAFVWQVR
jgi:hypothetical protein